MRTSSAQYDAFISYSHQQERPLAEALQSELQRFARPWYLPRALRVFRDTTNLAATPELWPSIVDALSRSEWFILMASPASAQSRWVPEEIKWWTENRTQDRMLIALADGEIAWDHPGGDFDWSRTTALPPTVSRVFRHEPFWIDLRSRPRGLSDPEARPQLGDLVAEFAAPIRGVDKDTLVGEHLVLERRTKRILRTTVATLSALLVAVLAATVFAVLQRNEARTQSRIAIARQLAATATSLTGSRMDLAQLFAVEAHRMHDDHQTRAALFQAVTASPALIRYLPAGGPVAVLSSSADGKVVVAGTTTGRVLRWTVAGGPPTLVAELQGRVRGVAVSADGSVVVADSDSSAVRWTSSGAQPLSFSTRANGVVAISPSGRFVVLASENPKRLQLLDTTTGRTTQRPTAYSPAHIQFDGEFAVVAMSTDALWDRKTVPALAAVNSSGESLLGNWGTELTLAPGGARFALGKG